MSGERANYEQLKRSEWESERWQLPELCVGGVRVVAHRMYTHSGVAVFAYDQEGAKVNEGTGYFEIGVNSMMMYVSPTGLAERGVQLMAGDQDESRVLIIDDIGGGRSSDTVIGRGDDLWSVFSYEGVQRRGFGCMLYPEGDRMMDLAASRRDFFYWDVGYDGVALIPLLPRRGEPGTGGVLTVRTDHLTLPASLEMIEKCMEGREPSDLPNVTFQRRMF